MSGIVGMVELDGRPVDGELLQRMTDYLAFRGPDTSGIWQDGNVGFGHTLFRTTFEAERESQPGTLDGTVWITADARIDDRDNLKRLLRGRGREIEAGVTDPELILHAYHAWGENCLDHLIGDFAFAIWDGRERKLFCARDHFGIKPFFYAALPGTLIFSNTLNCVRLHQGVSAELDDVAIVDFLAFGQYVDTDLTIFAAIRRLSPAHALIWREGELTIRRYWTLPADGRIRYKRNEEYLEHFTELFDRAVADRIRQPAVTLQLSGGMDSTSIAATARKLFPSLDLKAYTITYDHLIPDDEGYWSKIVADYLNIHQSIIPIDDIEMFEEWANPIQREPEPNLNPNGAGINRLASNTLETRVILSGLGGDPAFYPSRSYPYRAIKNGQVMDLLRGIFQYVRVSGRFPRLYVRSALKQPWSNIDQDNNLLPEWLITSINDKYLLMERSISLFGPKPLRNWVNRPESYDSLLSSFWPYIFGSIDNEFHEEPRELRFPFFNVQLINYLLAIPPLPWFENKLILRQAMRGLMPERVRKREKTPLQGHPKHEFGFNVQSFCTDDLLRRTEVSNFIYPERVVEILLRQFSNYATDREFELDHFRPLAMSIWINYNK